MRWRERVRIGRSQVDARDLRQLRWAWKNKRLVLFLGAGVSAEYGIPGWKSLVLELLFDQAEEARRLKGLRPHYRQALAEWLTEYFEYDPVILARVVKTDIERRESKRGATGAGARQFLRMVRYHLYRGYERSLRRSRPRAPARPTTLNAVAELIERGAPEGRIPAVVSFNFDDLLEQQLTRRGVPHHAVFSGRRAEGHGIPIVHPHGLLPREGKIPEDGIVFTEDEYHRLTEAVFHWAPTDVVGHLRQRTVLFIGLSMSDPNLRRLLDASHAAGDRPAHWQLQKRHQVGDQEKGRVMARVEERADHYGRILGEARVRDPGRLAEAIDAALRQADSYDRELFESMGVRTIWLEDHGDIPALLVRISR